VPLRSRIFTGPDGREYRWKRRNAKVELYLNDDSKRIVAKYHLPHTGWFIKPKNPATLVIEEPAVKIADLVVTTFVYMEKLRRDSNAGSGGGGGA